MAFLTWLHLSDLHYWPGRTGWDAYKVLSTLKADLKLMEQQYGLQPDLFFFTGDVAFGTVPGSNPEDTLEVQYQHAQKFFEEIRNSFARPIDKSNTFFVPGNHDILRKVVGDAQTHFLDTGANLDTVIRSIQSANTDWHHYMERLQLYAAFLQDAGYDHLLTDPDRLIYATTREVANRKIGIAGFNSAWSCCREQEKAKLWVGGRWQIGHLRQQLGEVDLSIGLIHHPSNWFREEEDPQFGREIERDFQFLLHGHEHLGWVNQSSDNEHIKVAAAACYDRSDKENGYNFVRIDMETGEGYVWLRRFDREGGGWIPRVVHNKTEINGQWKIGIKSTRTILDVPTAQDNNSDFTHPFSSSSPLSVSIPPHQLGQLAVLIAAQLGAAVLPTLPSSPPIEDINPDEIATQSQLEVVNDLINRGRPIEAQHSIIKLREEKWDKVSKPTKAKIANSQGAVEIGLENYVAAYKFFEEALTYHPGNVKIIANVAQAALLQDLPEALVLSRQALELDAHNEIATSVYLQALAKTGQNEQIDVFLSNPENEWIHDNSHCLTSLAFIASNSKNYVRSEEILKKVLETKQDDRSAAQSYMLLASVIIDPIQEQLQKEQREPNDLTSFERTRLQEAEEAYTHAAEISVNFDNRNIRRGALVSRSAIRFMLGDYDKALRDCERVLDEDAEEPGASENKARILLRIGRFDEAAKVLEQMLSSTDQSLYSGSQQPLKRRTEQERTQELEELLATAYLNTGQSAKAFSLLKLPEPDEASVEEDKNHDDTMRRAELLLYAAADLDNPDANDVEQQTLALITQASSFDPAANAILAQYYLNRGDDEKAISLFKEAIKLAPEIAKNRYQLGLARLFYSQGKYAEAVLLFREVIGTSEYHSAMPAFTVSLYNSGQETEALGIARRVRATQGIVEGVSEIEVDILERGGDLQSAREVLQQLIEFKPDQPRYVVRAAAIEIRDGHRDVAQSLIEKITYRSISDKAELLMRIARLRQMLDMPEVLRYGYRARRIAFGDSDIHAGYMMLCLNMDLQSDESKESLRERDTVQVGDAVDLIRDGKTITFVIEDEEPLHPERGEIKSTDLRAQNLLGHSKGEHIVLKEGMMGAEEYEIADIKSKYLHASHETTFMFEEQKLDHPGMQVLHAKEGEFTERFWKAIDNLTQSQQDVTELYRTSPIPLATFARIINRSILHVWLGITGWDKGRLFAFAGTAEDMAEQNELLSSESSERNSIVLDIIAMLTIVHLELEQVIKSRFSRIFISRATMDEISTFDDKLERRASGVATSIHGSRYFIQTPEEEIQREQMLVQKLLQFTEEIEVIATMGLLDSETEHRRALGDSALSSILLAQSEKALLYTDDLRLRQLAYHEWKVNGVETSAVLNNLQERQLISQDRRYDSLAKLAQSHYFFISMNAEGIRSVLEQNLFEVNDRVRAVFATLEGPETNEEPIIEILSEIVKQVWLRNLLVHQKSFVLNLSLKTLVQGRRRTEAVDKFLRSLRSKLRLVEHIFREIQIETNLWLRFNERT